MNYKNDVKALKARLTVMALPPEASEDDLKAVLSGLSDDPEAIASAVQEYRQERNVGEE